MCRFAGFFYFGKEDINFYDSLYKIGKIFKDAGPDYQGIYITHNKKAGFLHRRLSIIDISEQSNQPILTVDKQHILVFNGEIYNFLEIRRELEGLGYSFSSNGDSEVLLYALKEWEENALYKLRGMFSFAYYNNLEHSLLLARDRLGIKPLYWMLYKNTLLFSSQANAFSIFTNESIGLNKRALFEYFVFGYIPAPESIYKGVYKLQPGWFMKIDKNGSLSRHRYWKLYRRKGFKNKKEFIERMKYLLEDSLKLRLYADVPVGVYLSGGIDSSFIAAKAKSMGYNIETFTVGFLDSRFDESKNAKKIADYLGLKSNIYYLNSHDLRDIFLKAIDKLDEPFADSSILPSYFLSQNVGKKYKVVLSGDGGDEVMCGYDRYRFIRFYPLFRGIFKAFRLLEPNNLKDLYGIVNYPNLKNKIYKFFNAINKDRIDDIYFRLMSIFSNEMASEIIREHIDIYLRFSYRNSVRRVQMYDFLYYLPGDLLFKTDRSSMMNSLEVRVPLLDHRVVEFAWQAPRKYHMNLFEGKLILKYILKDYLPERLWRFPKRGFGVPIDTFITENKSLWFTAYEFLIGTDVFNRDFINSFWKKYKKGIFNSHQVYSLINLAFWMMKSRGKMIGY